jgi:hypothetical protein
MSGSGVVAAASGDNIIPPTSSKSNNTKYSMQDFEKRSKYYALSDSECTEINREQIAPMGSGVIAMRPVCPKPGEENLIITLGCDDMEGEVKIKYDSKLEEIESQCPGSSRQHFSNFMVEIDVSLYLDRYMQKPDLMKAMNYSEKIDETTINGKTFEAYGVTEKSIGRTLSRWYVELTPIETADDSLSGILFFPYAELKPFSGDVSYGKSGKRLITVSLKATMPRSSSNGKPKTVYGTWRLKG